MEVSNESDISEQFHSLTAFRNGIDICNKGSPSGKRPFDKERTEKVLILVYLQTKSQESAFIFNGNETYTVCFTYVLAGVQPLKKETSQRIFLPESFQNTRSFEQLFRKGSDRLHSRVFFIID